jgi:hypothetical protein
MRYLAILGTVLLLQACAVTVKYPNGQTAFVDRTDFEGETVIQTRDFYMRRTGAQKASTATRAAGSVVGTAMSGGAGLITAWWLRGAKP